ncbi:hypothetical protein Plec18167_003456 [Paecilomyces lecythidis]|uniref:Polarized growth protein Boi2 n=1 Tax=Paecilomyces lecythidis TaxID=3004212 RepID=A0ABR3XY34_9EURO
MAQTEPPRGVRPGDMLLVVHDFDARGADELTLRRGDKVELVELDEGFGDGWYLGKHMAHGTTGLFPGIYTTPAPKIGIRKVVTEPAPSIASTADSTEDASQSSTAGTADDEESRPGSSNADKTPQGSRHASASGIQAPSLEITAAAPSPQQSKRSSSSPLPSTNSLAAGIQRTIRDTLHSPFDGEDSPVMNETLSVIDEHITDLSTPRHSVAGQELKPVNDSGSEYSSHIGHRLSYIHGHETDEEEESQPTEEQVRKWSHTETAKQLRNIGVEQKHCDIFEEQEITGDVLLEMDQEFLFMKEFDFGVMGRRLKTWHKIKAFQEEVKGFGQPRGSVSSYSGREPSPERAMSRAGNGTFLPRIPSLSEKTSNYHQARSSTPVQSSRLSQRSNPGSPLTSLARPSAASIRDINHTRRHSSIDTTGSAMFQDQSHRKQPSFDRGWTMSMAAPGASRPGTSVGPSNEKPPPRALHGADSREFDSGISIAARFDELDRGYFSGGEVESRRGRKVLQKRGSMVESIAHSRKSSYNEESLRKSPMNKRHSRFSSAESIRDMLPHVSSAAKAYHSGSIKGRFRSSSGRFSDKQSQGSNSTTPIVTNLAEKPAPSSGFFSAFSPLSGKTDGDSSGRSSSSMPFQQIKGVGPKFRRAVGLRAASDTSTNGKVANITDMPTSPVKDSSQSTARTGSTTPSATSKSSERQSTDGSGKTGDALLLPRPRPSTKAAPKSKKDTSAYIRGLEKKTPQEQMLNCEFSGWMKKKSSHLMTTWKPRLFVLRGRRLSYYYSEDDSEERGLIDITGHRVLRADTEPLTALHATITGAKASPVPGTTPSTADLAISEQASSSDITSRSKSGADGPFIFKLVPPKMSRSVQFTKPAIHYFQVDSIQQGRLWMAALMKATIERDPNLPVEMTNKQKTISLKQARALNQRPPLPGLTEQVKESAKETADSPPKDEDKGLMIQGLSFEKSPTSEKTDSEKPKFDPLASIDTGPSSLLPESLTESPLEQPSETKS